MQVKVYMQKKKKVYTCLICVMELHNNKVGIFINSDVSLALSCKFVDGKLALTKKKKKPLTLCSN